jgi:quercetin dioxygenase-like cupin family protein
MTHAWDAYPASPWLKWCPGRESSEAIMKTIVRTITTALLCGSLFTAVQAQNQGHVIQAQKEAHWGQAPPMLPAGAQIAVLAGNPMGKGPYTIRLKFPAHYAIPAHSHPTDENVVVVSGALTFGMGEALVQDAAANKTLGAGGFALMPANMNHFAYTGAQETTIVLYGQGPVEFKYVNSADDPRTARQGTR